MNEITIAGRNSNLAQESDMPCAASLNEKRIQFNFSLFVSLVRPRFHTQKRLDKRNRIRRSPAAGFSLLEMMIVVSIIGILATISTMSWLNFTNNRRLATAQNQIYQAIRQAQFEAKTHHVNWQASFQNADSQGLWSIHSVNTPPIEAIWTHLPTGVQIDAQETTLRIDDGFYEVQFSHRGHVNGQLGRITVKVNGDSRLRRCVLVSTLIGALRTSKQNTSPRSGRYCY